MTIRKILAATATAAAGMTAAVTFAAPASAGSNGCDAIGSGDWVPAKVCFQHSGDKFTITDGACDNASAYYKYKINGGEIRRVDFDEGCNRSRTDDYNFKEGATVEFIACVDESLAPDQCGHTQKRTA